MARREAESKGDGSIPVSADLPASAPINNDVERAYNSKEMAGDEKRQMTGSSTSALEGTRHKMGKGLTEGDMDMDDLPKNNLILVMPAIGLVLFLAALDMSIVSTALPTIAQQFGATPSQYSWVGTAYTLAMTLQTPINGRVSDIIGRKPMLYAAILVFTVFSALCGAAKSMNWLIICRAFQGLGGGSILGLTNILVSDIVPLQKRGVYQGWLGGTWGIAAVLGPILGGLLTEKASWRWTFYINLPTCGIAFALLFFTLHLNPTKKLTFAQLRKTFDFLGLFLLMAGGGLLIVGFSQAADDGFDSKVAYPIIIVGVLGLIGAVVNFLTTKRNAIIPARMFKIRTTLFFLIGSTLQSFAFLPSNYLLPQLFQGVRGSSPLSSGIQLLPFACCVAWSTVIAGQINSRLRIIRPVAWVGYAIGGLGFALFYGIFRYPFSLGVQEGLLIIAGVGVGLSLQTPMLILQAAMPLKDMAAVTSAWTLTRSLGGSVGLAVFTAILNTGLRSRFRKIEGYGQTFNVPTSAAGYAALQDLPDGATKDAVLTAFADALGLCWIISAAALFTALLLTLWTRSYSLNRARGTGAGIAAVSEAPLPGQATPSSETTAIGMAATDETLNEMKMPSSEKVLPASPLAEELAKSLKADK